MKSKRRRRAHAPLNHAVGSARALPAAAGPPAASRWMKAAPGVDWFRKLPPLWQRLGIRTLGLGLIVLILGVSMHPDLDTSHSRPIILPSRVMESQAANGTSAPLSILLAGGLHLRRDQQNRLESLARSEDSASTPVIERIRNDRQALDRLAASAGKHGGASLSLVLAQAGEVSADSAALREIRQMFWRRAIPILTPHQRKEAERLPGTILEHRRSRT